VLCLAATAIAAPRRKAKKARRGTVTSSIDATTTPAYRYARLSQDACEAELATRKIDFARETARGVLAPVRLLGPLHGVTFRTRLSAEARETTPYEIADCRLVLALDDFAAVLEAHGIVEVLHYSMYRPPSASWPADRIGTRHAGALSLDIGKLVQRDGTVLDVDRDFHGRIGGVTCGPKARPRPATPAALELRAILCETTALRVFNVVLTPNHNRPHKNHFHVEVTAGVGWFMVD
jgi:hypothetical protein